MYLADTSSRAPVVLGNKTVEGRLKYLALYTPFVYMPLFTFFPWAMLFYLTPKHFPFKAATLAVLATFLLTGIGYGYLGIGLIT